MKVKKERKKQGEKKCNYRNIKYGDGVQFISMWSRKNGY